MRLALAWDMLAALLLMVPTALAEGESDDSGDSGESWVVGGAQASQGAWPDTAAIVFQGNQVGCTGTLIAPNLVLTASHCIGGISKVKLGTNNYNSGGEEIRVIREIGHPQHWSNYDVGVLVLERDATTVEPRPIAQGCILDQYLYDGADVAIVVYGAIVYFCY